LCILEKFDPGGLLEFIAQVVQILKKRYGNIRIQPMDVTILVYLGVIGILVIPFHRGVHRWPAVPFIHAVICFFLLEVIRLNSLKKNRLLDFIRTFYPVLWIGFAWLEMDRLVTMIFPFWANALVVKLDLMLFGAHPSVWVQTIFRPWLTELMNFFYFIYYLFLMMVTFPLYFRGRQQETFNILFLVSFMFAVCFFLFLIFPAEAAWVVLKDLHTVQPKGGFFLHLIQFLQARGSIRGGAFPSSHVAAAFVIALCALRYQRKTGLVIFPLAVGVALATVYCRYHHAIDAVAGILLGSCLYLIGIRILKRRGLT
jgi:membrane-associated phospholipid phosphatase